jgi:hypothetical protein
MSIGENLFYCPMLAGCPVGGGGGLCTYLASCFSVWAFFFFARGFGFGFGLVWFFVSG